MNKEDVRRRLDDVTIAKGDALATGQSKDHLTPADLERGPASWDATQKAHVASCPSCQRGSKILSEPAQAE